MNGKVSDQASSEASYVVGVDVGGTFTDLFVLDERDGSARIVKWDPLESTCRHASLSIL